jgi:hypothetical protein
MARENSHSCSLLWVAAEHYPRRLCQAMREELKAMNPWSGLNSDIRVMFPRCH